MHIVPFSAFDPSSLVSLATIDKAPYAFPPLGTSSVSNWRVNFDGVLLVSNAVRAAPSQRAYTQVYRTGIIEAVEAHITGGERPEGAAPRLRSIEVEGQILLQLVRYLKGLNSLGVEPPFAVMISLVGVKGTLMNVGVQQSWHDDDNPFALERDQYHFGEVILNTVPNSIQECAAVIRPFIEQLANTAGRGASSSFGPNGEYIPVFR